MPYRVFTKGEIIGDDYLVLEYRRGGLSDVYLTFDLQPTEYNCRAVKILRINGIWGPEEQAMLHQEAAAWVSLGTHPNIVRCFLARDLDEISYLVLDWVTDEESQTSSLRDFIQQGVIVPDTALRVATHLCEALLHCRGKLPGFAHGDIKPENVLVGEHSTFKLTDFGLAQTIFSASLRQGAKEAQVCGTPHYMAPEMWSGQSPDERTDLYAIGCLLYELFEGELPFPGQTLSAVRRSHLEREPQPPSLMPKPIQELVLRCLAKDAAERPAGYEELAEMVQALSKRPLQISGSRQTELTATDYGNQALTLHKTGHYAEALEAFEKALALDPALSRAYNNRALTYYEMGRHEDALRDWARAIEIDPEFVEAFSNRAAIYLERGQLELALQDAQRAVELNDQWSTGFLNLASILNQLKCNEEALAHVNRALELKPSDGLCLSLRGEILVALGEYEGAVASYEQVLKQQNLPWEGLLKVSVQLLPCLMRVGKDGDAYALLDQMARTANLAHTLGEHFLNTDEPMLAMWALRRADPEEEGVAEALSKAAERLIEMTFARDPRVRMYAGYRYWCDEADKMFEVLAEAVQGMITTTDLQHMLDVLAGVVPETEAHRYPLLRDTAFREVFERVVFPYLRPEKRRELQMRFIMLDVMCSKIPPHLPR